MARSTRRRRPGVIWIPPDKSTNFKITVERSDGTIDDISDFVTMCEIFDGVTDTIGNFKFSLWNPNETYSNIWTGMEIFRYYSDYATTATTLRFRGRLEKISYENNQVMVKGRGDGLFYMDIKVTGSFTNIDCSDILKTIISENSTGFTTNNVATSNVLLTVNWVDKPFWECVQELSSAANFDAYIDKDLDWNFFLVGSRTNQTEGIMNNYNLLEVGAFGPDLTQVRNVIKVAGAIVDGIQLIYTAQDTTSISNNGRRVLFIQDDNITNFNQAKDRGDFELSRRKNAATVGDVKGILLATIQPGEKIYLGSPENTLDQRTYGIANYTHIINQSGLFTIVSVEKEVRTFTHVMKQIIEKSSNLEQTSLNPAGLNNSFNFYYNDDTEGTHSNTEVTDGVLKLQEGQSQGTWTSQVRITDDDVTQAYLQIISQTITGITVQISADNGLTYRTINQQELITLLTGTGKNLIVQVTITDTSTQIDSLSILYT